MWWSRKENPGSFTISKEASSSIKTVQWVTPRDHTLNSDQLRDEDRGNKFPQWLSKANGLLTNQLAIQLLPIAVMAIIDRIRRRKAKKSQVEQPTEPPVNSDNTEATAWNDQFRIDFAPEFVTAIQTGTKRATTRVLGELDPNTDLVLIEHELTSGNAVTCTATCVTKEMPIAIISVTNAEHILFEDITDDLARTENCRDAAELQQVLRQFYPSIQAGDKLIVFHFKAEAVFESNA
mmetsp:Transcript_38919/g.47125  ORF Transcript_38919/g.47125 Transcript_38919/m.47125 type:complete len:236 (-) Transcript_38919:259-966(-)|eukprot:CAMPEP_0197856358 /NCGR_PEP_ID=MMETSP1438-20131217/28410_1 /TAXON_ID=1461541 /ORGANISM="Pterosperma sp., Strain CCMP1384" /LENGTH=235 /DNA_ID=CAMNT_0043471783 /DNA_START=304 /DNA_END=1011 /DNA_ORIENTATION=+